MVHSIQIVHAGAVNVVVPEREEVTRFRNADLIFAGNITIRNEQAVYLSQWLVPGEQKGQWIPVPGRFNREAWIATEDFPLDAWVLCEFLAWLLA